MILYCHSTEINAIPPPCLYLKQCARIRSVNQRNILGGWFHVIINLQPLISDKGNIFFPIGGVENTSFNKVLWGRWLGGKIMDIWGRRGRLFVKEEFRWPLLLDNLKPLSTMEGLPVKICGREENGFV